MMQQPEPHPWLAQQLADVISAQAVSAWPPAPGWWLLAGFLVLLGLLLLSRLPWRRWRAQKRWQKHYQQLCASQPNVADWARFVRQLAMSTRPAEQVAGLTGHEWLAELDADLGGDDFTIGVGALLAQAHYLPPDRCPQPEQMQALQTLVGRWLKSALSR